MGLRGPLPKDGARRQRRNAVATVALTPPDARADVPAAPRGLLAETRRRWDAYWRSELASAVRDVSMRPAVERLFQRYDERERAYRTVRTQGRVTAGSQRQLVQHPLLKYIDACDSEIRALEDRLGLSPKAMVALGAKFAEAKRSLDDINQQLADDDDVDPRLEVR